MKLGKIYNQDLREYLCSLGIDPDDQESKRDIAAKITLANFALLPFIKISINSIPIAGETQECESMVVAVRDMSMNSITEFFEMSRTKMSSRLGRDVTLDYDGYIKQMSDF